MRSATTILLLFALVPRASAAQQAVPVDEEPKHHLVFETPYVRIIDARLPPGYVSLYHIHARDNVPVAIEGGPIEVQLLGEEANRVQAVDGSVSFAAGGYTHRVSNLGNEPVRFIDVEIVATPTRPDGTGDAPLEDHVLELENERVRVYRVRLDTGTKRSAHRHPGAVLAVVARGEGSAEAESGSSLAPGDFRWHEGGALPTVEAAERSEMEIVEIEWQ